MRKFRFPRQVGWVLVCFTILVFPRGAAAQDYSGIVQAIFENGEFRGEVTTLSFVEGDVHQYAVAEGQDPDHLISLSFIEEHWSKSGGQDIIDQWIVSVHPKNQASHTRVVEQDSELISTQPLAVDGADAVVQRIIEKISRRRL